MNRNKTSNDGESQYLCVNCSSLLFLKRDVSDHGVKNKNICNWIFIAKKNWINVCAIKNIFKIKCPSCEEPIGEGALTGLLCNCGNWTAPAFRVFKEKVKFVYVWVDLEGDGGEPSQATGQKSDKENGLAERASGPDKDKLFQKKPSTHKQQYLSLNK